MKTLLHTRQLNTIAKETYKRSHEVDKLRHIHGKEYSYYFSYKDSNPLLYEKLLNGTLTINGQSYVNVLLGYDTYKDLLIIQLNTNPWISETVMLKKSAVQSFRVQRNRDTIVFENITFAKDQHSIQPKDGFYEVLRCKYFTSYRQYYSTQMAKNGSYIYYHKTKWMVKYRNQFYYLNNKGTLLKLFPNNKKEILDKLRSLNTPFGKLEISQYHELVSFINDLQ